MPAPHETVARPYQLARVDHMSRLSRGRAENYRDEETGAACIIGNTAVFHKIMGIPQILWNSMIPLNIKSFHKFCG